MLVLWITHNLLLVGLVIVSMKMKTILFFVAALSVSDCANILGVFQFPSQSHHILGHALFKGLAKAGHNVTMMSPFPVKEKIDNYTHLWLEDVLKFKQEKFENIFQANMTRFGMLGYFSEMLKPLTLTIESKQMELVLKPETKFDLIIAFAMSYETILPLADRHNIPVILFAPIGGMVVVDDILGNISPYSYVPSTMTSFTDEMNFLQRTTNTLVNLLLPIAFNYFFVSAQKQLITKYYPEARSLDELKERIALVLVNSHVSTESPRPYIPNMIQIGGFHIQEPEVLPADLKSFLDNASEGVIYFSFGSNVKLANLGQETIDIFVKKLRKLPFKILMKYEADVMPDKPDNFKISEWLPQRAILDHPNVIAFVSHGGMGSTTEALYYGVPLVCIPFFGDQQKNCVDVVNYGFGVQIDRSVLSESTFSDALDEILNNSRYREAITLRSELFREQPIKPLDHAVFWVNHVLKHKGAKHLRNKASTLYWYQYLLLDVVAFLVGCCLILFAVIYYSARYVIRKLFLKKGTKTKIN